MYRDWNAWVTANLPSASAPLPASGCRSQLNIYRDTCPQLSEALPSSPGKIHSSLDSNVVMSLIRCEVPTFSSCRAGQSALARYFTPLAPMKLFTTSIHSNLHIKGDTYPYLAQFGPMWMGKVHGAFHPESIPPYIIFPLPRYISLRLFIFPLTSSRTPSSVILLTPAREWSTQPENADAQLGSHNTLDVFVTDVLLVWIRVCLHRLRERYFSQ